MVDEKMICNNISVVEKEKCFGCGACENICPKKAIKMEWDNDGFLYPTIGQDCILCGKCLDVCQAVDGVELSPTPKAYAAWISDKETLLKSSSGGVFSVIANYVIYNNGAVFGAMYSEDFSEVYIKMALCYEQIEPMRGSKYVFSQTLDTYTITRELLDDGKLVLYTGTPCQVAGLLKFLGRKYENLITVDFVCHGANSVKAYKSWLKEFTKGNLIHRLDFRDKTVYRWSTTATAILENGEVIRQKHEDCYWYKGFLEGVINRENCSTCPYADVKRCADITLGDAWQVGKIRSDLFNIDGTSLILENTIKGKKIIESIASSFEKLDEIPLEEIRKFNGSLNYPQKMNPARKYFFTHIDELGYHKALWYGRGYRWDIGIVGWWFASNYGSLLTYYSLGRYLESMGKAVIFIQVPQNNDKEWDNLTIQAMDFIRSYFKISKKRDCKHLAEVNKFCDSFILGSDQMWTESTTNQMGYTFFLDFVNKNKKKISCSTSFGTYNFSNNDKIRFTVRDYLKQFDAISVREDSGVEICKNAFNITATQIIDPIFWMGNAIFDEISDEELVSSFPEHYVLCYILDPSKEKQRFVEKFIENRDVEVITILGLKEFDTTEDIWKEHVKEKPSPEKFITYFRNAEYIITDSHHGVCLSIIYKKDYIALVNSNRGIDRFLTVANKLGLEEQLVFSPYIYKPEKSYFQIDYDESYKLLDKEVERAKNWLKEAFDVKTNVGEETVYMLLRRIEELERKVDSLS